VAAPPLDVEHHAAFVNGVRIHYVRAGSGKPIVLLHGWPQTWYMWRKVIPVLAEHYTVIAPDLRGFGESSKPIDGYDKRTVAEDIYQLVQQLGFDRVSLVGHDMGGPTAYAYACAHPEEVQRMAILDVGITIDKETSSEYFTRLFHLSFHAEPDIAVALVSGRERTYLTHFYRNCYNPGAFTHEDIGLGLGGELGFRNGVRRSLEQVATDVRGGTIAGCAHWIAEEQPEELCRQLLEFFGEAD